MVRVTEQSEGERNYHIFYQYMAALGAAGPDGTYHFPQKLDPHDFFSARRGGGSKVGAMPLGASASAGGVSMLEGIEEVAPELEHRTYALTPLPGAAS